MRKIRMSGSVGASGEQSPEATRPELLPPPHQTRARTGDERSRANRCCCGGGEHRQVAAVLRVGLFRVPPTKIFARGLRVFEVDPPATQARKRTRLQGNGYRVAA